MSSKEEDLSDSSSSGLGVVAAFCDAIMMGRLLGGRDDVRGRLRGVDQWPDP